MNNTLKLIALLLLLSFSGFGQSDTLVVNDSIRHHYYMKKSITLITGYHLQKNQFAEVGCGIMKDGVIGHHPSTIVYGISNEINISDDFIWGLKAGLWAGGGVAGMNMGLNFINYTDFSQNSIYFRPEIGLGVQNLRIVYGYNLDLSNVDFEGVNKHNFGLNIMFNLKTLKEDFSE